MTTLKKIKEMLDKLENHAPGYKLSLLRRVKFSEKRRLFPYEKYLRVNIVALPRTIRTTSVLSVS
jgi:hypothetical protein